MARRFHCSPSGEPCYVPPTMRQRLVLASVSCCILWGSLIVLSACGGSASETPPPLQPDPKGFHYASLPMPASTADSDAGALPASSEPDVEEQPHAPARATWGSPKAAAH